MEEEVEKMSFSQEFATITTNKMNKRKKQSSLPPPSLTASKVSSLSFHLLVSMSQRGNPVLSAITNVPYTFMDLVPDFVFGTINNNRDTADISCSACALFLSLKFHLLTPNYIVSRVNMLNRDSRYTNDYTDDDLLKQNNNVAMTTKKLKSKIIPRVLLLLVDRDDYATEVSKLSTFCLSPTVNLSLVCAFSPKEVARYLEGFKLYERKGPEIISGMGKALERKTFDERVENVLKTAKGINKTDTAQLNSSFKSFKNIATASIEELSLMDGMGEVKVKRLFAAMNQPFVNKSS